jgi:hypothetical protein
MDNLLKLEDSVTKLSMVDFKQFREWFFEYENEKWDNAIASDIESNKLASLAKQAIQDFKDGKFAKL